LRDLHGGALRDADGSTSGEYLKTHLLAELQQQKQREQYLAYHDSLTGLPNRMLFRDRLEQALAQSKRTGRLTAVLFLDLDGFKRVNDTLGHTAGDQLLQGVAERLKQCVRTSDTVARLGGDEFTIILTNVTQPQGAATVAEKVRSALARPLAVAGQEVFVTTSIGISFCPTDGSDAETLLKRADRAMYSAKAQGKNTYQLFIPAMEEGAAEAVSLENDLHNAVERGELVLHYQPQVDVRTRAIVGVEALVRWQHPSRGLLGPLDFIPLAEENGLIVPLGEWVLRTACQQARAWEDAGLPPVRVTVNVSPRQFRDRNLVTTVSRILGETRLAPQRLGLEITESSAILDTAQTLATLRSLSQMGVQLLIDDFGTGSSLFCLKLSPIDVLKIEPSFIAGLPHDRRDAAITTAAIGLAHNLGLRVIAKHVQSDEQAAFLLTLQCDEFQGYLFSRPLRNEELAQLLAGAASGSAGQAAYDALVEREVVSIV
jgi:diguanylate cyclase (GGDEF)-like protein